MCSVFQRNPIACCHLYFRLSYRSLRFSETSTMILMRAQREMLPYSYPFDWIMTLPIDMLEILMVDDIWFNASITYKEYSWSFAIWRALLVINRPYRFYQKLVSLPRLISDLMISSTESRGYLNHSSISKTYIHSEVIGLIRYFPVKFLEEIYKLLKPCRKLRWNREPAENIWLNLVYPRISMQLSDPFRNNFYWLHFNNFRRP